MLRRFITYRAGLRTTTKVKALKKLLPAILYRLWVLFIQLIQRINISSVSRVKVCQVVHLLIKHNNWVHKNKLSGVLMPTWLAFFAKKLYFKPKMPYYR